MEFLRDGQRTWLSFARGPLKKAGFLDMDMDARGGGAASGRGTGAGSLVERTELCTLGAGLATGAGPCPAAGGADV